MTYTNLSMQVGSLSFIVLCGLGLLLSGCTNAPYPEAERNGSVLFSELGEDPKSLDPTVTYDANAGSVLNNIVDTFLEYDYLKRDPLVLIPAMGARMPERRPYVFVEQSPVKDKDDKPVKGPDGKPLIKPITRHGEIWTFTLKHGVRYADDPCFPGGKGREAAGGDFIFAFKRMVDPTVSCPILNYVTPHILGMQEFFDAETEKMAAAKEHHQEYVCDLTAPIKGLEVDPKDPYTFRITMRDPYPQLKYLMAMSLTAPIPPEAIAFYTDKKGVQFRRHPVGAGPYRLAEWSERQRIVLERNPYYHTATYPAEGMPDDRQNGLLVDAGKPLPLTDKVVFSIIKESIPGWNMFEQGYMDSYGVPREAYDRVVTRQGDLSADMKARGIQMRTSVGMDVNYFAFNMEDPLVGGYTPQKRKLRQALSLAYDADEFIEIIHNGQGIAAQGAVPPGIVGYDRAYRNRYRQTNLQKAKQLLAEAGYTDGVDPATHRPLELFYDDSAITPEARQVSGLFIRQIERLGIRINERGSTYAVFMDHANNGQFQLLTFGWVADYPDPENFYLLFYGPNKGPGPNTARYDNPVFNKLYLRMSAMDDGPERLQVIHQMDQILEEDCPWIFNYYSVGYGLRYDWVKNSKRHPVAMNTAKYIRIDYKLRTRKQAEWNAPRYDVVALMAAVLVLGVIPAVIIVRRRRSMSARAARKTLISQDGQGVPQE